MSAPLFVTACSLTKEAGGVFEYDGGAAILASLEQRQAESLVERRNAARKLVKGGGDTDWQGIRLADHPHNRTLAQGEDFGGTRRVEYMPAIDRYKGRFFLALDAESRQRCKTERRTLILSGLYGMLLAGEPIQLYSCPLTPDVAKIWQEDSLLTSMLCGYVQRNGIACVVDLTAMEAYRRLIDWQTVANHAGVMHCFDTAAAGRIRADVVRGCLPATPVDGRGGALRAGARRSTDRHVLAAREPRAAERVSTGGVAARPSRRNPPGRTPRPVGKPARFRRERGTVGLRHGVAFLRRRQEARQTGLRGGCRSRRRDLPDAVVAEKPEGQASRRAWRAAVEVSGGRRLATGIRA